MSLLPVAEAESLGKAFLPFFGSQLGDVNRVDIHSIRIVGGDRRMGGVVGHWDGSSSFGKVICLSPLGHEAVGFGKPLVEGVRESACRVDPLHEADWDACSEVPDKGCIYSGF